MPTDVANDKLYANSVNPSLDRAIIHTSTFSESSLAMRAGLADLTQMCGNNFQVLKVAPPLVVMDGQVDEFVSKLCEVVESIHSSATFWTEALGLARRVVNI
jgi:acetylornithine/succinyldiaminopimelate/putrescine aminotransferase